MYFMLALRGRGRNNASTLSERTAFMPNDNKSEDCHADPVTGRAKGGPARAAKLSEDDRKEIARKGAIARWGLKATHKGNFKDEFGIDVDCYVLNDDRKTAVVSQRGMGAALGLVAGGLALPRFLSGAKISPYVGAELITKLGNPLIFQGPSVGLNVGSPRIHGYDVTILIDICKAIIRAESEGKLLSRQSSIAKQAHIILNASAKAGIKGLVYALSGYDASREEVVEAFKFFVREEAREYEKEFPDQLYREWYRLYKLPKPERNRPWKFMHLTIKQVYRPLAKSNGKILQLTESGREISGKRHARLHQFLSEIGVKALRQHLGQLLGIAQVSRDQAEYEKHITQIFGGQLKLFD
jgi:hypothetical protein